MPGCIHRVKVHLAFEALLGSLLLVSDRVNLERLDATLHPVPPASEQCLQACCYDPKGMRHMIERGVEYRDQH